MINKIIIKNFKSIKELNLSLKNEMNILVGNNEQGKSTILEAINLALTATLNKRNIHYEISPFIFNKDVVNEYIENLKCGYKSAPPSILIEVYLNNDPLVAKLKGTNNTLNEDIPGISFSVELDENFSSEYQEYISNPEKINNLPIEYYKVNWYSFDNNPLSIRSNPIKCILIDGSEGKAWNGTERYISNVIGNTLELKQKVALNLNYRGLKEDFTNLESIIEINNALSSRTGEITDKNFKISLDVSQKNGWESGLTAYIDDIPFEYIGKGEQSSLKVKLSLEANLQEAHIILLEEPETHLSFTNMNKLIQQISTKCIGKQLLVTTHSTYVLNKLGLENLILMHFGNMLTLDNLSPDTYNYFKKLPGYDTLRLVLSNKTILVEGPSDELIYQKAYLQKYGKLPIEDGIDVITIRGLSFKRFLEIADKLSKDVYVITDNDGDVQKNIINKYKDYMSHETIKIFYSDDINYKTLEPQLVKYNTLESLNTILGTNQPDQASLIKFMTSPNNKNECSLKLFDTKQKINIPEYFLNAL